MNILSENALLVAALTLGVLLLILFWIIGEATRSKQILSELRKIKRIERLRAEREGVKKEDIEAELAINE